MVNNIKNTLFPATQEVKDWVDEVRSLSGLLDRFNKGRNEDSYWDKFLVINQPLVDKWIATRKELNKTAEEYPLGEFASDEGKELLSAKGKKSDQRGHTLLNVSRMIGDGTGINAALQRDQENQHGQV